MALKRERWMETDRSGRARVDEEGAHTSTRVLRAQSQLVGDSKAMRAVRERIEALARYGNVPVLFVGEPGAGKELAARALHELTNPDGPFIEVRCDGTSDLLADIEVLELAKGGTVFLSGLDMATDAMRAQLHRTLDAQRAAQDGAPRVRILSAARGTHPDDVAIGPELLARIAGFTITIPPLRDRRGDIVDLAEHFLEDFSRAHATPPKKLTSGAIAALRKCAWPGNVRQLRAVVEAAVILSPASEIDRAVVEECIATVPRFEHVRPAAVAPSNNTPLPAAVPYAAADFPSLRDMERALILSAWTQQQNNLSRTASHLGIPRSTLRDKLRRFGVL